MTGGTFYGAFWISSTYGPLGGWSVLLMVFGGLLALLVGAFVTFGLGAAVAAAVSPSEDPPELLELMRRYGQGKLGVQLDEAKEELGSTASKILMVVGEEFGIHFAIMVALSDENSALVRTKIGPLLGSHPTRSDLDNVETREEQSQDVKWSALFDKIEQVRGLSLKKKRRPKSPPAGALHCELALITGKKTAKLGWVCAGKPSKGQPKELTELALDILESTAFCAPVRNDSHFRGLLLKHGIFTQTDALIDASETSWVGKPTSGNKTGSWLGGCPQIPASLPWPEKDGRPLAFIGQLSLVGTGLANLGSSMVFFYAPRYIGLSPNDRGHCRAIPLSAADLEDAKLREPPEGAPKYKKVSVSLDESLSLPDDLPAGIDSDFLEPYIELAQDLRGPVQLAGFGHPANGQERDNQAVCAQAVSEVPAGEWRLLLQVDDIGDMPFGDAGSLSFYSPSADIKSGKLRRVWAVANSH